MNIKLSGVQHRSRGSLRTHGLPVLACEKQRRASTADIVPSPVRWRLIVVGVLALCGSFSQSGWSDDQDIPEKAKQWTLAEIPSAWKNLDGGHYGSREYYAWFRCIVEVPDTWEGEPLELFVEAVDDAREIFFNGQKIGSLGMFPPEYRSGLGLTRRLSIDPKSVLFGESNVVAIRVYQKQGRGGFNVAAPVLFSSQQAIRMRGMWQLIYADKLAFGKLSVRGDIDAKATFSKLDDAQEVTDTLKKLDGDEGPLSVAQTLEGMTIPADLSVRVVLAEPDIGQPLSIKWDTRGRLWVAQYLQYPDPAGLRMVSRDKYLRAVYDQVPPPPPHHFVGRDKISIHEDGDGDGYYESQTTFVEGLSLATSFAIDHDGVWILNPPYLLFYPDKDHDDVPDGDPEVHLEGFGIEDSHSIANSLRWGPDGWLYAAQGSTVTGHIRPYGSQKEPIHSMGQLIWRYHPQSKKYEIFAEGGGNSFGVEVDSKGRIYSGYNGGDTRGFHYVQGGYYRKGFGKHGALSNPYTFGYFSDMDHPKVERFTHDFVIYEDNLLPQAYQQKLFGVEPLQGRVVYSNFAAIGSSFKTDDLGFIMQGTDTWMRPVDIDVGPDGAIYVADLYEQRIDHASHYQGRVHHGSGRIYRFGPQEELASVGQRQDLAKLNVPQIIQSLTEPRTRWELTELVRLLGQRADDSVVQLLREMITSRQDASALPFLWALNLAEGLDEATAEPWLHHADPYVRLWTVRLICDDQEVSQSFAKTLAEMALSETHIEARCQLACSARRLPASLSLPMVRSLLHHASDVDDVFIPLSLWWAVESKVETDRDQVLAFFADETIWDEELVQQHVLQRLMRRFAMTGKRLDLLACARLLEMSPGDEQTKALIAGFEEAFKGRSLAKLPSALVEALAKSGGGSLALRLRQEDASAITEALKIIQDADADIAKRLEYISIFSDISRPECVPVLLSLVKGEQTQLVLGSLTALGSYTNEEIGRDLIMNLSQLPADMREVAESILTSRKAWAERLLASVDMGELSPDSISQNAIRKALLLQDETISAMIKKHWGEVQGATTAAMLADIKNYKAIIGTGSGNPYAGKKLFMQSCGKCHQLFQDGGDVGPNLTAFKRDDLNHMLVNVVNPSIAIREGYENYVVFTDDGRTINGFISDQDSQVVVIKSVDAQSTIVPRQEIDEMMAIKRSVMPEGILQPLTTQQIRDLFAYLRATQPLP